MTSTILGWHHGEWGSADALGMPLTDRSLQLADGLFETIARAIAETMINDDARFVSLPRNIFLAK